MSILFLQRKIVLLNMNEGYLSFLFVIKFEQTFKHILWVFIYVYSSHKCVCVQCNHYVLYFDMHLNDVSILISLIKFDTQIETG